MPEFNLVDEPWIPCRLKDGAGTRLLSVRDALLRAPEIDEIAGETPLVTVGLHRLLLAILHRCFGPADAGAWQRLWQAGAWDAAVLTAYLDRWRPRFDLFDETWPFYQTAALDFSRGLYPLTRQFLLAGGATIFDHAIDAEPPFVAPAEAARLLIAFQISDVGGIKSAEHDKDFADASPLTQCAVGLVWGDTLFRTLMLNLHRYHGRDDEPFHFDPERDAPAWERDDDTQPVDRAPDGYLDLLTWQSRRLRLLPEVGPDGEVGVRRAVVMKGFQFPTGYERRGKETMVAFRRILNARGGQDPWLPIGFQEERAFWRDSLAVFQSIEDFSRRPRMLDWLNDLVLRGVLGRGEIVPMEFYGIAVDRANARFWRHERLLLPLAYLDDQALFARLREGLSLAEDVGRLCRSGYVEVEVGGETKRPPSPFRTLAGLLVGLDGPIADVVARLAPERVYWSRLEARFRRLVVELPEDGTTDAHGDRVYGELAFPRWVTGVTEAAREAFAVATSGLDTTARTLKAVAVAERDFNRQLRLILDRYRPAEAAIAGGEA